jgi:hypothetical protein
MCVYCRDGSEFLAEPGVGEDDACVVLGAPQHCQLDAMHAHAMSHVVPALPQADMISLSLQLFRSCTGCFKAPMSCCKACCGLGHA